ncbi:MAG: hypothetical protein MR288_03265 [Firmicutes bacterium]|nr:hypothetical protein [Bacillota bacterium]MDY5042189.1 hypothetical protein [Eubacteriales bacterium]
MAERKNETLLNSQRIVIIILSAVLLMTLVGGVTFAWYTRVISDMLGIRLSDPVEIYITDELNVPKGGTVTIPLDDTIILPGTRINMKLGFVMGMENRPSSPAFVRVKLKISSNALTDMGGDIIEEGLVDFDNGNSAPNPISSDWVEADFGSDDGGKWWVFSENVDGVISARTAYNGEKHTFIDGQIRISTKLTNIFANKDITIDYVVSAIQTMNVENPIKDINNPTWGKLIED